jgi:hypothetical protein
MVKETKIIRTLLNKGTKFNVRLPQLRNTRNLFAVPEGITITESDAFPLYDGVAISNDDVVGNFWLKVAVAANIVYDETLADPNSFDMSRAFFTVEEPLKIVEQKTNRLKQLNGVLRIVEDMTPLKQRELLTLLGRRHVSLTDSEVYLTINDIATKTGSGEIPGYEQINNALSKADYKERLFVNELINNDILRLEEGQYRFKELFIGHTIADVIAYVMAPENANQVDNFKALLKKK